MDKKILEQAIARIKTQYKILILKPDNIAFEEIDFDCPEGYVWLYENRCAFALIKLDSIIGVTEFPWHYVDSEKDRFLMAGSFSEN